MGMERRGESSISWSIVSYCRRDNTCRNQDGDVISIIRKYLVSGIRIDDEYEDSVIGTPQGGNLSPLLANIISREVQKENEETDKQKLGSK